MATIGFQARSQKGITLIEVLLVAVIIAATVVGVFIFSQKSNATAAVKQEQSQVEAVARTVENIFSYEPNFQALGMEGADYLRTRASQSSGLTFEQDQTGKYILRSSLSNEPVVIRSARVDFPNGVAGEPNNGFVLTYLKLAPSNCVGFVSAIAPLATRVDVGPAGVASAAGGPLYASGLDPSAILVAFNGTLDSDKSKIASACKAVGSEHPIVYLSFAPSRSVSASLPAPSTPGSLCHPINETQIIGCPTGQVGSIMQQRFGTCTGPGNSLVYTSWTTTEATCVDEAVAPPGMSTIAPVASCSTLTLSQVVACPAGQSGLRIQTRNHDTCTGTYTPWTDLPGVHCSPIVNRTCFPSSVHEDVACPSGMSGIQRRTRGLHCPSPTSIPQYLPTDLWTTYSNTCQGMPTCSPVRETDNIRCDAGFYGDYFAHRERFRACTSANVVGAWSGWAIYEDAARGEFTTGSCTACPPNVTETDIRWVGRSGTCPVGQLGTITWEAEQSATRTRYYDCPARTVLLPPVLHTPWTAFTDTGATRNNVNTCENECVAPGPSTESQNVSCPVGQSGGIVRERTTTWSCPAPTGLPTSSVGAWAEVSNTCAANCVPDAPQDDWRLSTTPCPVGYTGINSIERRFNRTSSCPTTTGSPVWGGWLDTGDTRNPINTCTPSACTGASSEIQWLPASASCPVGHVGTNTWEAEQIRTRTCTAGTWGGWSGWSNTGNTRNTVNTCTPATCSGPNSETQWVNASAPCPVGQTGSNTWQNEQVRTRSCNSGIWGGWGGWANTGATRNTVNTCAAPPAYNGQCNQVSRPTSWGCGEVRRISGVWVPTAGTVMIDDGLNGGWFGNGTIGTRCVYGYVDVLDAFGYPTPLNATDAGKFIYDYNSAAPGGFYEEFLNGSDGSWVGNVGYGSVYARNVPPTIRGTRCSWTKFEFMNN